MSNASGVGATDLRLAAAYWQLSESNRRTEPIGMSASKLRRDREERDLRDAAAQERDSA